MTGLSGAEWTIQVCPMRDCCTHSAV